MPNWLLCDLKIIFQTQGFKTWIYFTALTSISSYYHTVNFVKVLEDLNYQILHVFDLHLPIFYQSLLPKFKITYFLKTELHVKRTVVILEIKI